MLRYGELPLVSELPAVDDDHAPFDLSPEWLASSPHGDEDDDALGLRVAIEEPETVSRPWRRTASALR